MMIKDYSREIVELRRRSNALLPISQLPDSLLAEIFGCYKALYDSEGAMPRLIILRITHVCHSWRVIASSYGKLWADIYPVCAEQVRHWLERSAKCPLDLETRMFHDEFGLEDLRSSSESEALRLALEELPRIRTLSLHQVCLTKEQLSVARWTNSPVSLPLLQSLHVQAPIESYAEDVDDSFCLTALFLLRDLPSLTQLRIGDDRFLSSNSMRFPRSLTHLEVFDIDLAAPWNPNMISVILSVLDTLPSLESLKLSWQYDGDEDEPAAAAAPTVQRQVALSRLQKLSLDAFNEPNIAIYFLDSLTFPSATIVYLFGNHRDQRERLILLESIARKLDGHGLIGDRRPLHTFCVTRSASTGTYRHTVMGSQAITQTLDGDSEADIRVDFSLYQPATSFGEAVRMICDTLPLSEVELLMLHNVCLDLKPETFPVISHNMPALHSLCIRRWTHKDSAICTFDRTSQSAKGLFPKLRNIHLEDLCNYSDTIGFWDFLVELLASRKERGASIETLSLIGCNDLGSRHLKLLRELVDELIWKPTRG